MLSSANSSYRVFRIARFSNFSCPFICTIVGCIQQCGYNLVHNTNKNEEMIRAVVANEEGWAPRRPPNDVYSRALFFHLRLESEGKWHR